MPVHRANSKIRKEIMEKIAAGQFNLGIPVLETEYVKLVITTDGKIEKRPCKLTARKYLLSEIREKSLLKNEKYMRVRTDDEYNWLNSEELKERLRFLNEPDADGEPDELRARLKDLERTRHWLVWHDHAGIASNGLMLFLLREVYDPAIHLTNDEYMAQNQISKRVDVQAVVEQPHLYMMGVCGSSDADQMLFIPTRQECLRGLSKPLQIQGVNIKDKMRFMNGDNPSVEFEDGTQKGGHRGCVGCDGDMRRSDDFEYMSHRKYKTLEEKQKLVFAGTEGKKGGLHPFKNLKVAQLRSELQARGEDDSGPKQQLQERIAEVLGGTTRLPALLYGDSRLKLEELNLDQYEVLFFEPLHCCLNHISHVLEELPHHITDVETLVTLKETLSIALTKDKLRCTDYRRALLQVTILLAGKAEESVMELLTTLAEMMGTFYAKEDSRNPRQILRLANLSFRHALAVRTVLTPPKTMTSRKLHGIYYHSAVHHAAVIYRLVCLSSINAELFERFFDRIVDITRKTWSKQAEDLVPNAFLHIQGEDCSVEENTVVIQEWEISKLAKRLPDRANTTVSKALLIKKPRLWQAHLEVISDFLLPGPGVWWHWKDDGSVEFYDGPKEATDCPEGPRVSHFRSSSIKAVQSDLEIAWKRCCEKPQELPAYKLRDETGKLVYDKLKEASLLAAENDDPEEIDLSEKQHGIVYQYLTILNSPTQKINLMCNNTHSQKCVALFMQ